MSTCNKTWRFPSDLDTFNESYVVTTETKSIYFEGVDLTDCPFSLSLTNITDPLNPAAVDHTIVGLTQPVLRIDSNDPLLRSVSEPGSI